MDKFVLNEFGIMGGDYLRETLTSCTDPIKAIEDFQRENGILLPSLQSALPFLDLHDIPRHEFHHSILNELKSLLLHRIHDMSIPIKNDSSATFSLLIHKDVITNGREPVESKLPLNKMENVSASNTSGLSPNKDSIVKKRIKKVEFVGGKLKFLKATKGSNVSLSSVTNIKGLRKDVKDEKVELSKEESENSLPVDTQLSTASVSDSQEVLASLLEKSFPAIQVPDLFIVPMTIMEHMTNISPLYLQRLILPTDPTELSKLMPPDSDVTMQSQHPKLPPTKLKLKILKKGKARAKPTETYTVAHPSTLSPTKTVSNATFGASQASNTESSSLIKGAIDDAAVKRVLSQAATSALSPSSPYSKVCTPPVKRHIWRNYYPIFAQELDHVFKDYIESRSNALLWGSDGGERDNATGDGDYFSINPKVRRSRDAATSTVVEMICDKGGARSCIKELYESFKKLSKHMFLRSRNAHYASFFTQVLLSLRTTEPLKGVLEPCRKLAWLLDACLRDSLASPHRVSVKSEADLDGTTVSSPTKIASTGLNEKPAAISLLPNPKVLKERELPRDPTPSTLTNGFNATAPGHETLAKKSREILAFLRTIFGNPVPSIKGTVPRPTPVTSSSSVLAIKRETTKNVKRPRVTAPHLSPTPSAVCQHKSSIQGNHHKPRTHPVTHQAYPDHAVEMFSTLAFVLSDPFIMDFLSWEAMRILDVAVASHSTIRDMPMLDLTLGLLSIGSRAWEIVDDPALAMPPPSRDGSVDDQLTPELVCQFVPALMVLMADDRLSIMSITGPGSHNTLEDRSTPSATKSRVVVIDTIKRFVLEENNPLAIRLMSYHLLNSCKTAAHCINSLRPNPRVLPANFSVKHVLPVAPAILRIASRTNSLVSDQFFNNALVTHLTKVVLATREWALLAHQSSTQAHHQVDGEGAREKSMLWLSIAQLALEQFFVPNLTADHIITNAYRFIHDSIPDQSHLSAREGEKVAELVQLVEPTLQHSQHIHDIYQRYISPKFVSTHP